MSERSIRRAAEHKARKRAARQQKQQQSEQTAADTQPALHGSDQQLPQQRAEEGQAGCVRG